jgi:transcriptional regulator with XRE-family HTH domain
MEQTCKKFSTRLIQRQKENGLCDEWLADGLGFTKETIARYTKGQSLPTVQNLIKIADYLNCSVDYLLGRTYNPDETVGVLTEPDISNFIGFYNKYKEQNKEIGETTIVISKCNGNLVLFLCTDFEYSPDSAELSWLTLCSDNYQYSIDMPGFTSILNFLYSQKCAFKIDFDWLDNQLSIAPKDSH